MELSRRDLLYKCMAIGVIKLGAGLSPASAVAAWMRPENLARPATPMDQLGPFYKKGAPNRKMMRGARDAGLALGVHPLLPESLLHFRAEITAGRVGPEQSTPRREFE